MTTPHFPVGVVGSTEYSTCRPGHRDIVSVNTFVKTGGHIYPRTLFGALLSQDFGVLVVAHAAYVPHRLGWQHVLCSSGCVLGGAAWNELCVAVLDQIVIQAHLVGFGEECVVEFQPILLEHGFVAATAG